MFHLMGMKTLEMKVPGVVKPVLTVVTFKGYCCPNG